MLDATATCNRPLKFSRRSYNFSILKKFYGLSGIGLSNLKTGKAAAL